MNFVFNSYSDFARRLKMLRSDTLTKTYNDLLPIKEATTYLAQNGGDATVSVVLEKIVELGLGDDIGLRLLHKHNDLAIEELMIEREIFDLEGYALITAAVYKAEEPIAPNSWRLMADSTVIPIEFSAVDILCSPNFDLLANKVKLEELRQVLVSLQVEHVLGPCINYDQRVYGGRNVEDVAFLEKTDTENRINVVRPVDRVDPSFTNSAKTKWYAKKIVGLNGNATWITACNCFCSVFPNGGHIGTKTHTYTAPNETDRKSADTMQI
jgi:hypothetical protein